MQPKKRDKQRDKILRKNDGKCTICKGYFPDDPRIVTYTCFGYDKLKRLQLTSGCCSHKLEKVIELGLFGDVEPEDVEETMQNHPLYEHHVGKERRPKIDKVKLG